MLRRLVRRRGAMAGLGVVVLFVVVALAATWLAPYDPLQTSWSAVRKAPSVAHWFGTDEIGRDVLSRVIWGTRASLLAGLVSVCISLSLGVPIGLAAGYLGRGVDALISRITDAMLACPFLILAIALAAFLSLGSVFTAEMLTDVVHTPRQLEGLTGHAVLATVPENGRRVLLRAPQTGPAQTRAVAQLEA